MGFTYSRSEQKDLVTLDDAIVPQGANEVGRVDDRRDPRKTNVRN